MKTASSGDLEGLREEIARITANIIETIGRRNELARQVGRIKDEASLPHQDDRVEDSIMRAVINECDRFGVSRGAGLKVLSVLLAESKRVQGGSTIGVSDSPMTAFEKAAEMQRLGKKVVRLDVGEPDFKPPRAVLEACSEALFSSKTHYTMARGIPELVSALRTYLKERNGFDARDEELLITAGGRFAVYASISSLVGEGESAVVIDPSWPAYKQALLQIGAKPIIVHTMLEDRWALSPDAVRDAVRPNTKAIILSYPNNPSGKIIDRKTFLDIVGIANDNGLTVISDEAYAAYSFIDCPSVLNSDAKSFVLAGTFSKTWAMTGFRLGYAVSSEMIIDKMLEAVSLMLTSVPEFIQYGAVKALESETEAEKNRRTMSQRVDSVCKELDRIESLRYYKPDGAMYVFPQAANRDFEAKRFADRLLEERGVSVTPGEAFGDYPKSIRISLGQPVDVLVEGIRRIGEALG